MAIPAGTHIGPYEIVGWLGAGGMGDVYRARDPRLGRDVALKLVAELLVVDPSRLHRFEQEARAAGQLNHPNILAIYDVGAHAGAPYIVSELLEGESLRSRLGADVVPWRKAVDIARQTAEGLAAAHDKGIVHRDVKPDNLFVTSDGRVKILDFGIAKLTRPDDEARREIGAHTATAAGVTVGTASYMSPEQVRGEPVDARSDLFSLGAVLHELLSGRPPFVRATSAETMTAILKEEPLLLPETVPPSLARTVARCLEKAREARFQSARDLAFGLEMLSGTGVAALVQPPVSDRVSSFRRRIMPWTIAGAAAIAVVSLLWIWGPWRTLSPNAPVRLPVDLGVQASSASTQYGGSMALSPDDSVLAFVAQGELGRFQLYVRRLDQLQALPLAGTDAAIAPFFSPDGQSVGFFGAGKLRTIPIAGGAAVTICDAPEGRGGTWLEDGTIVFAPNRTPGTRLLRVSPAAGSTPEPVAPLADGEVTQMWPHALPGGRLVLFTSGRALGAYNEADLVVLDLQTGNRTRVHSGGYYGRYLPSGARVSEQRRGHLVYIHDGTILAVPFDLDRLEATGPPVVAQEGVMSNSITGGAQFAASAVGTLVYLAGPRFGDGIPLEWMDHDGNTTPIGMRIANWFNVAIAPDGGRLAIELREGRSDIWVYEFAGGRLTKLTADPVRAAKPVWTPDGRQMVFASARGDGLTLNLYWQPADGSGHAVRLTTSANAQQPGSVDRLGKYLAFEEVHPQTRSDVMMLPIGGNEASGWTIGKPEVFLNSPAQEAAPMFSPDGRWVAYGSNESGRFEVYVRPFPGPGAKTPISTGGGMYPTWSRTTADLYYAANGQIMVVPYRADGRSFHADKPRLWSQGRFRLRGPNRMFDVDPKGARFALAPVAEPTSSRLDHVTFVFNFVEELSRIAPAAGR